MGCFATFTGCAKIGCTLRGHIALRQIKALALVAFGAGNKFPIITATAAVAVEGHTTRDRITHARIVDVVAGGGAVVAATGVAHVAVWSFPAVLFI